jgi:cytokinin dehydrogenase
MSSSIQSKSLKNKQTDFGEIYFNSPSEIISPKSTFELSQTLKKLNKENKKVTIRNTGHSVNGQTLTNGIQIDLSEIKNIIFDEDRMEVSCGAGNSWSEVFEGIFFPKYSLPIFPNNPKQKIQIGGTASVGGVGPYSFKYGGFWNCVCEITLVTMTGEILKCSKNENQEYFHFALGGFGKIGVISELKVKVIPSQKNIVVLELLSFSDKDYFSKIKKVLNCPEIVAFNGISKGGTFFKTSPHALMLILESENLKEDYKKVTNYFDEEILLNLKTHKKEYFDFNFTYKEIPKSNIFNYYPIDLNRNHILGIHPWSDYILPEKNYLEFINELRKVIKKYDLEKRIITQSFLNGLFSINMMPTYIGKNIDKNFELVPQIMTEEYSYGIGFMPTIEKNEIPKTLEAINTLTKICFDLGGKRYLYGIHSLDDHSLEKQFGKSTLVKWGKIKRELDPKNLLNTDVICKFEY